MKAKVKICVLSASSIIIIFSILAVFFHYGILKLNNPSKSKYPLRGVDVSSYQGDISWDILSNEGISFAFIKATEGSTYKDIKFEQNWKNAQNTDLYIGAYHFFSYDSPGKIQAENFISAVSISNKMLPPVVDIEYYGDYHKNPKDKSDVIYELNEFLKLLEEHYGVKPIIYTTMKSYNMYICDEYSTYPIWIRNVFTYPNLPDKRSWTFWQYTDKGILDGFNGEEKFIDINVFNGNEEDLKSLCLTY